MLYLQCMQRWLPIRIIGHRWPVSHGLCGWDSEFMRLSAKNYSEFIKISRNLNHLLVFIVPKKLNASNSELEKTMNNGTKAAKCGDTEAAQQNNCTLDFKQYSMRLKALSFRLSVLLSNWGGSLLWL